MEEKWDCELATGNEKFLAESIRRLFEVVEKLNNRLDKQQDALKNLLRIIKAQQNTLNEYNNRFLELYDLLKEMVDFEKGN